MKFEGNKFIKKIIVFVATLIIVGCSAASNTPTKTIRPVVTTPKLVASTVRIDSKSGLPWLSIFDNQVPKTMPFIEKYSGGHPDLIDYVFVRTIKANVRELPSSNTDIIEQVNFNEKIQLLGSVNSGGYIWYKVKTEMGRVGYVFKDVVEMRTFRFEESLQKVNNVERFLEFAENRGEQLAIITAYVPNPLNVNFKREEDKYGNYLDQAAEATEGFDTIYIPDRTIISIIEDRGSDYLIRTSTHPDKEVVINKKHVSLQSRLSNAPLNKAIAVDTVNQNMIVFEKIDGKWSVISYVHSKTGIDSQVGFDTPRGNFLAAVSRNVMLYNSEIGEKQGYARYATRFSGGGYLHGTPVNYEEEINQQYFITQKEWTLGTFTGTRKCVRTSEDHARFIFNWILNGKANPKSNDHTITDNVLFVTL